MDGLLIINKEKNMTSRDVVNKVCKLLNTKKIGHTGTLDPLATGVLVLAVNKGLKIVEDITSLDKEYVAEVTLGIETDTLDITGNILKKENVNVSEKEIDDVLKSFIGNYNMEVPLYSAKKINGKKLYEYARNNEEVDLPINKVYIYELERISNLVLEDDLVKFFIRCKVSKGTYIRSLIRDISKRLNTLGVMSELKRTKQGIFSIDNSYTLNDIENNNYRIIKIDEALILPKIEVPKDYLNKVKNGNKIDNIFKEDKFYFTINDEIIGIYEIDKENDSLLRPYKMF